MEELHVDRGDSELSTQTEGVRSPEEEPTFGPLTFQEFWGATFGLAKRLTRSLHDAEDLVSDTMRDLLARNTSWPEDEKAAKRVARQAMVNRNISNHRYSTTRPHMVVAAYEENRDLRVAAGASVADQAIAFELRDEILQAVEGLTPALREVVLVAMELEEGSLAARSQREMGALLGVDPGSIKRRLHDARMALQAALADLLAEEGELR